MASIDPTSVTKVRIVGRRAHALKNLIRMESVRTDKQKEWGEAYGYIQPFRQRRSLSHGNADEMGERTSIFTSLGSMKPVRR